MTALWALVVVVNKKILESVTPLAVNFLIRLVAIAGLLLLTVPLTVFGLWSNGFGIDAESAGWIALSAVATWLVAFNAYYYALRGERVAVVAPICSTDPIWTAFFAWLLLGSAFGGADLRRHGRGDDRRRADLALDGRGRHGGRRTGRRRRARRGGARRRAARRARRGDGPAAGAGPPTATKAGLIGLAVLTAAGWGLGPVFIDQAATAYGRATASMMLLSQALGALMLGGVLLLRRAPLACRPLTPATRRRVFWLIVLAGTAGGVGERALLPQHRRPRAGAGDADHGDDAGVLDRLRRRPAARAPRPAAHARGRASPWPACSSPRSTASPD